MSRSVWVLGNLTIDDVVTSDGGTAMGLCGGNAIYAALGAALWAPSVGVVARIGPDYPERCIGELRRAGIGLTLVPVERPSIRDWALYESDDERRFVPRLGSGTHLEQSVRAAELPRGIGRAAACHVAPMPGSVQAELVAELAARGVGVVALDPHEGYIAGSESQLWALLRRVALFLPSRREAAMLYGRDDPEAAAAAFAAAGPRAVAVKLGADGSLVCGAGGRAVHVPAVRVRAVDPTGCGDAYCGGFMAAYARGADPVTAACHGTVSASFTAETRGATAMRTPDRPLARERLDALRARVAAAAARPRTGVGATTSKGGQAHATR